MKHIANCITGVRILLAPLMLLTKPLGIAFYALYLICGMSDVLDGYIARRTGTVSSWGGKLDSIADLVMVCVMLIVMYPIIHSTVQIIVWIALIGVIRTVSVIIVLFKYKTFGITHTYGNKLAGLMLFIFPLLLAFVRQDILIAVVCGTATLSAVEELLINFISKEFDINRKGLFFKKS